MRLRSAGGTLRAHLPRRLPWEPWSVLVPLVVAQWLVVALVAHRAVHNSWLFYHDATATWNYTTAWIVGGGHIPATFVGYGLPLLLAPVTWFSGPNFVDALHVILPVQVLVLLPLGVFGAYVLGARSAGRLVGYTSAAIWTLAAWMSMHYLGRHPLWFDQILPMIGGLTELPYLPATLVLVVAGALVLRALDERRLVDAAAAGAAAGFAIGIKPTNVLFLFAPLVAFTVSRRWRELGAFAAAVVPCLLTYGIWREKGLGHLGSLHDALLIPGPVHFAWINLKIDFGYLNSVSWSPRFLEWIAVAGFVGLFKRSPVKALFFGTWLAAYVLAEGGSRITDANGPLFWHLIVPSFPALCVLTASLPLLWPRSTQRLSEAFPYRPRRLVPAAAPALALVALVLPLVAVAAVPALHEKNVAAELQSENEFVPIENGLRARVSVADGSVLLAWDAHTSPAKVFYAVYRAPTQSRYVDGSTRVSVVEGMRCADHPGATRCVLEMRRVATTRATTFAETPPPGRFTYRVAVVANYLNADSERETLVSISPPLNVRTG